MLRIPPSRFPRPIEEGHRLVPAPFPTPLFLLSPLQVFVRPSTKPNPSRKCLYFLTRLPVLVTTIPITVLMYGHLRQAERKGETFLTVVRPSLICIADGIQTETCQGLLLPQQEGGFAFGCETFCNRGTPPTTNTRKCQAFLFNLSEYSPEMSYLAPFTLI
jgi:hypothetical protein